MPDLSAFPITARWPARHPDRIQLYSFPTPNGVKVSIALEELGLPYEAHTVQISKNETWIPEFLSLNPNGKIPAIIDPDGPGGKPLSLFESGAILLYLAEKTGRFLPPSSERAALLSWLMFVATGIGPFSGQAVHFRNFAPEKVPYANDRYQYEAKRHYGVLDRHLAEHEWMVGEAYGIVDMAVWGWARMLPFVMGEDAYADLPNVKRHVDAIAARPAAAKAVALKDRFTFKAEFDAEARGHMFKHLAKAG